MAKADPTANPGDSTPAPVVDEETGEVAGDADPDDVTADTTVPEAPPPDAAPPEGVAPTTPPGDPGTEPSTAELPPDIPIHQNTGVTPEPNPDPLGVFSAPVGSLEDRVAALEKKVDIIGKTADLIAQGQLNAALQAQSLDVPDTAHYQCSRCLEEAVNIDPATGTAPIIEAVHPAKWYAAMGPITCPFHPGEPQLMVCLEVRDQQRADAEAQRQAVLATTTARPAPLPQPGGDFSGMAPPPPPAPALQQPAVV